MQQLKRIEAVLGVFDCPHCLIRLYIPTEDINENEMKLKEKLAKCENCGKEFMVKIKQEKKRKTMIDKEKELEEYLNNLIENGKITEAKINFCIKIDKEGISYLFSVVIRRDNSNVGIELFDISLNNLFTKIKKLLEEVKND